MSEALWGHVAARVKELRAVRKMSQEKLSRRADIGYQTVRRVEGAVGATELETLYAIAQALDVDLVELLPPREQLEDKSVVAHTTSRRKGHSASEQGKRKRAAA